MQAIRTLLAGGLVAAVTLLAAETTNAADAAAGEKIFKRCQACHSLEPGVHKVGPSLASLWGRKAGLADGYKRYSKGLEEAGFVWDAEKLDVWLRSPTQMVKGAKMPLKLGKPADRDNVIAFLRQMTQWGARRGSETAPPAAGAAPSGAENARWQ